MGHRVTPLDSALKLARAVHGEADDAHLRVGLAWHILEREGSTVIWHNGETGGFSSFLGFVPDEGRGVVVLTNSAEGVDDIGWHILLPSIDLEKVRRPIARELMQVLDSEGKDPMVRRFAEILTFENAIFNVDYSELKRFAYSFLPEDCTTAVALFEEIIVAYPEIVNAHLSLGEAYFLCGRWGAAMASVEKAEQLNPDDLLAAHLKSVLLSKRPPH
jgi:tetratricopeptide (TPR) repeat protein